MADVSEAAYVHPSASLGESVVIHPFVYIGKDVSIGDRTVVGPGTAIQDGCKVGADCQIAGEVVIGGRGYGYHFDGRQHVRIPQVGTVEIGDRTVIGPGVCIDRATLEVTSVGSDCEIGPLTQIAHNCRLADDCRIGGGSGLAGSTRLGRGARLGQRVGTAGHSEYGENVRADDLAGITKTSIPAHSHWAGYPARMVQE